MWMLPFPMIGCLNFVWWSTPFCCRLDISQNFSRLARSAHDSSPKLMEQLENWKPWGKHYRYTNPRRHFPNLMPFSSHPKRFAWTIYVLYMVLSASQNTPKLYKHMGLWNDVKCIDPSLILLWCQPVSIAKTAYPWHLQHGHSESLEEEEVQGAAQRYTWCFSQCGSSHFYPTYGGFLKWRYPKLDSFFMEQPNIKWRFPKMGIPPN